VKTSIAPALPPLVAFCVAAWALPADVWSQAGAISPAAQTPERSDALAAGTALAQARRLRENGDAAGALRTIEMALERLPRDVSLRFTRAVMQADLGQVDAAIAGFTALTQEYPELPEPYNNLATLHASRGDLDRARTSLDEAVRAMPVYALAWENLGDVHLRLAERAWQQASRLDKGSEAGAKLKLARELIDRISPPVPAVPTPAAPSQSGSPIRR
jgi:Flp pilus assembly protein TadD